MRIGFASDCTYFYLIRILLFLGPVRSINHDDFTREFIQRRSVFHTTMNNNRRQCALSDIRYNTRIYSRWNKNPRNDIFSAENLSGENPLYFKLKSVGRRNETKLTAKKRLLLLCCKLYIYMYLYLMINNNCKS